jgi:putative Mg2+ transporter-C (MgtC) family protein
MHDPWVISDGYILLRLLLSVLLGGLVGFERERKNHAAGLRTHVLVCLGSCLIMILSMYGFAAFANEPHVSLDPARLAAQVITGIGFLGAGTILINGRSITGLTTAASVWVVMAIGLTVGAGFYAPAIYGAVLVLFTLWILHIVERRYLHQRLEAVFVLLMDSDETSMDSIQQVLAERGIKVIKVEIADSVTLETEEAQIVQRVKLKLSMPIHERLLTIVDLIRQLRGVRSVSAE